MKANLGQIAEVRTGHSLRTRINPTSDGNVFILNMGDLDHSRGFDVSKLSRIQLKRINKEHLLQQDDLLFRSRGKLYDAVLIDSEIKDVIVASPLLRITVKRNLILPGYLAWYLNHPNTQRNLIRMAQGTSVQMMSKQTLEDLEIEIPSLDKQQLIATLSLLVTKEKNLVEKIVQKRGCLIEKMLTKVSQQEKMNLGEL